MRTAGARTIGLAPFGWHTRYLLRSYVRYAVAVTAGLLLVAVTIDLTPRLSDILASSGQPGAFAAARHVLWYVVLRSADILARNLPLSVYLGVLWAELAHTLSGERVVIGASGRSPLQSLVPAVIAGVFFGCAQISLDVWLRPAAVMEQTVEHLGRLGERFDRRPSSQLRWIKMRRDLVSAQIQYGPPPKLRNVTLYRFFPDGEPREFIVAHSASPAGAGIWRFDRGSAWSWSSAEEKPGGKTVAAAVAAKSFDRRVVNLDLDPLWVSMFGIGGKYLPQSVLRALAFSPSGAVPKSDYRTWLQVRYARGLYMLGMVLLAASLGQLLVARLPRLYGLLGFLLAGYLAHIAVKCLEILGEQGVVPPAIAGWLIPGLLVLGALGVQLRASRSIG